MSKIQHCPSITSGVINPSEAGGNGFGFAFVIFRSRATPNRLAPLGCSVVEKTTWVLEFSIPRYHILAP